MEFTGGGGEAMARDRGTAASLSHVSVATLSWRWAHIVVIDLAAACVSALLLVKVGSVAAAGTVCLLLLAHILAVRKIPRFPRRGLTVTVASAGLVVLLIGAGYAAPRIYLKVWGAEGSATLVSQGQSHDRSGHLLLHCTVQQPTGSVAALQASTSTCRALGMSVSNQVAVVYDRDKIVRPIAGTKRQLTVGKSLAPCGGGTLLILYGAVASVSGLARAERRVRGPATAQP